MNKLSIQLAAITLLAAGSATAADLRAPVKAPPPIAAPVASWTGCYVGAGGGYGMYDLETQVFNAAGTAIGAQIDQGGRGWFGTVQVGCDFQAGSNFVIGVFADWDFSGIKGSHTGQSNQVGLVSGDMKLDWSWAVGGRIGYLVTPTLLGFVSGGYTQANFGDVTYFSIAGAPTGFAAPEQKYSGYFIGGGTEYALTWLPFRGLFWKSEYRYAVYQEKDLAVFSTATGVPTGNVERTKPHVQTIRSELVWRFNWADAGRY